MFSKRLCNFKCLCSRHAQRKYDHGDVQSESNSDDNAWGILQLLAWMLVHEFPYAPVGILQVISKMVMLLALFLFSYCFTGCNHVHARMYSLRRERCAFSAR